MEESKMENPQSKISVPESISDPNPIIESPFDPNQGGNNGGNTVPGNYDPPTPVPSPTPTPAPTPTPTRGGLTDPNKIKVTITDASAPIIILFGAGASGKTMTLVRLTRWLLANGYQVEPDRNFRASDSAEYEYMCNIFMDTVNSDYAADRTHQCNFMLIKVRNRYGEPICQILEAPGEHYFDYKNPQRPFPPYINTIRNSANPKTWMFIVEKDWIPEQEKNDASNSEMDFAKIRRNYAEKVLAMQGQIRPDDRVIFTCHKADKHPGLFYAGRPNTAQFFKEVKEQYPGIFTRYENKNPISRLWRKYNFDFVIFSAGNFNDTYEGGQFYTESPNQYPAALWKSIMKTVKGGW